ncbi:hypothetical protein H477_0838 [[Clostridium] sordellii ATCC 9714]|nr:hypothetical protein H477_0838 [[Clostridium] sordellii ATCC 9714] [Paeniclostridium sordellii ATCC 9714]
MKSNKYRNLDKNQKQIRLSIMNMIIDEKRPVSLDEVTKELKERLIKMKII